MDKKQLIRFYGDLGLKQEFGFTSFDVMVSCLYAVELIALGKPAVMWQEFQRTKLLLQIQLCVVCLSRGLHSLFAF